MVRKSLVLDTSGVISLFIVYELLNKGFKSKYLEKLKNFELLVPEDVEKELKGFIHRKTRLSKTARFAMGFLSTRKNPLDREQLKDFSKTIGISLKRKVKKEELQALKLSVELDVPLIVDEFGALQHFKSQFQEHKMFLSFLTFSKILLDICLMHMDVQDFTLGKFIPSRWTRELKSERIEHIHALLDQVHLMKKP